MARWTRWLPVAVVPAAVAAVVAGSQAGAAADLPDRSPQQVLALMAQRDDQPFSGTFRQTSDLGLPALPQGAGTGTGTGTGAGAGGLTPAELLDVLTGSHTGRVYVGGPDTARLQVMDALAERDAVRNGRDVWLYDSRENAATHLTLPAEHGTGGGHDGGAGATGTGSPDQLADRMVAELQPTTALAVGQDVEVAGRPAYQLVLTPKPADTLVGSVEIAVDGATGLPLRVAVLARDHKPAFEAAFTALDLGAPDAARFAFTPPPGAKVTQKAVPEHDGAAGPQGTGPEPTVVGSGWDAVAVLPAGTVDPAAVPMLQQAGQPVAGGRLVSSRLVNALLADDGRVLVGAVPLERLQAAAGK
ncbi:LolA family protein [Georgenia thermotolerans]|uniref:MucB/RseB N-terminal domain-containing protein n=1 Tax=Georgenia thermotolerans TaxID=527326 RepID=A0A7J5UN36_9MICO|nr:sigma-E factor regulatory protein RseB domain-containing protein [Georgenia thermotolerans]KAE8763514.1 hypothetical protein GB883_13820 [Georgenia thermotolerans]